MVIKWLLIGILIGWLTPYPYLGPNLKKQYGNHFKKRFQDIGFGDNMDKVVYAGTWSNEGHDVAIHCKR